MLIRAFAKARLAEPAELVIAGSGARVPELKRIAAESGAGNRVRFVGRVPDSDLPGLYRLSSLFVLISRRGPNEGEGIPLTPLEAAACGVPIVVGNEDGSREAPIHGETGFIVPSRDEDVLVALLESCSPDHARLAQMARAAAIRAKEVFSYERFVADHRNFLAMVQAARRGAGT
jgi:phosphatidylinositol alpha-1,6-mannosyltransferase